MVPLASLVMVLLVGAAAGWAAAPFAAAIAGPRYALGSPGYDPEDEALAPIAGASSTIRWVAMLACALAFAGFATSGVPTEAALVLCATVVVLGVACLIDLQYLRLPNVLTYGTAVGSFLALSAVSVRLDAVDALRGAAVGGLGLAGFLLVVSEGYRLVRGRTGMGLGDIKLALPLGFTAGWVGYDDGLGVLGSLQVVVSVLVAANVLGLLGGLALTWRHPERAFPFGPFLLLGWAGVLSVLV